MCFREVRRAQLARLGSLGCLGEVRRAYVAGADGARGFVGWGMRTAEQVMDLCTGGDFFDFLSYRGSVTEDEARALFLQVPHSPPAAPSHRL